MRLVTFVVPETKPPLATRPRFGALSPDGALVVDFTAAAFAMTGAPGHLLGDVQSWFEGGEAAFEAAENTLEFALRERTPGSCHDAASVRLLAPVPRPASVRDFMGFERHVIQATQTALSWRSPTLAFFNSLTMRVSGKPLFGPPRVWYELPVYYTGNPRTVTGPDSDIVWPSYTEKLDFELEFGLFIGRQGKNIPPERAMEYVAGYTIFNDFSARDFQMREMAARLGPAKGKSFDTGNAMGPWLVTKDEVGDPYSLEMEARVNGELWSKGSSGEMRHRFEHMIAHASLEETLYPGDFIGSGTVGGGCGLELDRWIEPGDVVELSVSRLGVLRNRVSRPGKEAGVRS
jgi:2-keto-4-pentenoate hydratase/2-oxohepta-3-ene-1,7-dioic acid hydratase in catechol pathway